MGCRFFPTRRTGGSRRSSLLKNRSGQPGGCRETKSGSMAFLVTWLVTGCPNLLISIGWSFKSSQPLDDPGVYLVRYRTDLRKPPLPFFDIFFRISPIERKPFASVPHGRPADHTDVRQAPPRFDMPLRRLSGPTLTTLRTRSGRVLFEAGLTSNPGEDSIAVGAVLLVEQGVLFFWCFCIMYPSPWNLGIQRLCDMPVRPEIGFSIDPPAVNVSISAARSRRRAPDQSGQDRMRSLRTVRSSTLPRCEPSRSRRSVRFNPRPWHGMAWNIWTPETTAM